MSTPQQKKQRRKSLTPTKSSLMTGPKPRAVRSLNFGGSSSKAPAPKPKSIQQQITDAFYDPKTGLWSAEKIYKKLKAQGVKVRLKDVKDVLEKQLVTQVYKPAAKPRKERFNTIWAKRVREQYQADLLDMKTYTKFNKNFRYLLNVIDVHSRYAYAVPLKTKNEQEITPAMEGVFEVMGKPEYLNTDLESAIVGKKFQAMLKSKGVKHYQHDPVDDKRNMSLVERFNRTIRDVLVKYFYSRDTKNWVDILPNLLANYNSTVHSTTKQEPVKIWKGEERNQQKINVPAMLIQVGDTVRILKRYATFTKKSDVKKFTKNEYKVVKIEGNTYHVKNEKNVTQRRKQWELQKINPADVEEPAFEKQGEGKQFKEEKKKERAARQLAKEDITSDLVNTAPAAAKRERKPVLAPEPPKPRKARAKPKPKPAAPAPEEEGEKYDIERLLEKKTRKGKVFYKIEWKGYPIDAATWEPRTELVRDFGEEAMKELESDFQQSKKAPARRGRIRKQVQRFSPS